MGENINLVSNSRRNNNVEIFQYSNSLSLSLFNALLKLFVSKDIFQKIKIYKNSLNGGEGGETQRTHDDNIKGMSSFDEDNGSVENEKKKQLGFGFLSSCSVLFLDFFFFYGKNSLTLA